MITLSLAVQFWSLALSLGVANSPGAKSIKRQLVTETEYTAFSSISNAEITTEPYSEGQTKPTPAPLVQYRKGLNSPALS